MPYALVFDEVILKQLKQAAKNNQIKVILKKILDRIEKEGPNAGKLVDSQLFLYEIKLKTPPLRLYFRHSLSKSEMYIFEYEIKSSEKKQQKTIDRLRKKASET
ncbi:MAG: hypothetical protein Q8R18_02200 [bacterium]|nr:hypothetical protein [bacterium]